MEAGDNSSSVKQKHWQKLQILVWRAKNKTTKDNKSSPSLVLSLNSHYAACVNKKWIGCLLVKLGAGANAVCISSDGMLVLMHYERGIRGSCNIQRAGEAVGEANTACSQRCSHLRAQTELCMHTFRRTTGRKLTQLSFFKSYALLHTQTQIPTVGIQCTKMLFFFYKKNRNNSNFVQMRFGLDMTFELWPAVSRTYIALPLCAGLLRNRMVILHYGSTVIWREWALQTKSKPHINTHRRGYCKCV